MAQPKSIAGIILLFIIIVGDILTGAVSSHAPSSGSVGYSLNYAIQASGPNISVILPPTLGVFNCTGITTGALNATSSNSLLVTGTYTAASINVTNWYQWMFVNIGTSPPSTSFGNGICATASQRWSVSQYFPVTGVTNLFGFSFSYRSSFTVVSGQSYYAWIDIEQRGIQTGHVNYRNTGSSSSSSLLMVQLN